MKRVSRMDDQGPLNIFIKAARALGVLSGVYLLWTLGFALAEEISYGHIPAERWINDASTFILGILLVLPWRFVRIQLVWWLLYILLGCAFLNVLGAWSLSVGWAVIHGAHSGIMGLVLVAAAIAVQFVALVHAVPWRVRTQRREQ